MEASYRAKYGVSWGEMIFQEFDRNDPVNRGRPSYFDPYLYLVVVEQMIAAEEIERALWMLDNPPGWYRMNPPESFKKLRDKLYEQFHTTIDYSNDRQDDLTKFTPDEMVAYGHNSLRFKEVFDLVEKLNKEEIAPHIIEIAPGNGFLADYLLHTCCKFTYIGFGLGHRKVRATEFIGYKQVNIFVCFEVIEHLHNPIEIYHHFIKQQLDFSYIFISTPYCTWKGGFPNWYEMKLGHLRTYNPKELAEFGVKHWPNYKFNIVADYEMVMIGKKT